MHPAASIAALSLRRAGCRLADQPLPTLRQFRRERRHGRVREESYRFETRADRTQGGCARHPRLPERTQRVEPTSAILGGGQLRARDISGPVHGPGHRPRCLEGRRRGHRRLRVCVPAGRFSARVGGAPELVGGSSRIPEIAAMTFWAPSQRTPRRLSAPVRGVASSRAPMRAMAS